MLSRAEFIVGAEITVASTILRPCRRRDRSGVNYSASLSESHVVIGLGAVCLRANIML
jgi:hypothetical protein